MIWGLLMIVVAVVAVLLWAGIDSLFRKKPEERLARELAHRRLDLERLEREAVAHETRTRQTYADAVIEALQQIHNEESYRPEDE